MVNSAGPTLMVAGTSTFTLVSSGPTGKPAVYYPDGTYSLGTATTVVAGTVRIGSGINLSSTGTVSVTNGLTSVYARNALPSGTTGLIITISDSGTDANAPAGNYAPAYWDPGASVWTYIGNSNSVTPN
jgi:hypothetical protein